jgi:hypothetical protein
MKKYRSTRDNHLARVRKLLLGARDRVPRERWPELGKIFRSGVNPPPEVQATMDQLGVTVEDLQDIVDEIFNTKG